MYIKIEFVIILAVFFTMFIVVLGLGWYHIYLKQKGEDIVIGEKRRQLAEYEDIEEENHVEALSEVNQEIKEADIEEERAEKKSELGGRFVVELFEEIREPLNEILDMQDQILKADSMGDAKKGALETRKSGEVLISLIDDILDISKMESGQYILQEETYNLRQVLKKVTSAIGTEAHKKNITFTASINEEIPDNLIGDTRLIKRIFSLLLEGAVKHTEVGSVCFHLDYQMKGDGIWLKGSIDDTGVGIRQEDMSYIFRMQENNRNLIADKTIIGLNFCKESLEFMGGSLQMESIYGTGSQVLFEMPQKISEEAVLVQEGPSSGEVFINVKAVEKVISDKETAEKEEEQREQSKPKVLVVDDNIVNVKVVTSLLEPYELKITSVYSGHQCLDEVSKNQDYAMILLDHMMPGMDGIETLHKLRAMEGEYFANVPVVVLTATVMENTKEAFEKEGFQDYVAKPVNIVEMEKVLKKYIHSEKLESKDEKEEEPEEQGFVIEGVDINIGLRQWNGNLDKYKMILEAAYTDGKQKLAEMKQYLADKDYEKYMIEAHSAKSVSASIGAMKVSELAKEQEFAVKNQEIFIVETKSESFLKAYETLLSDIGNYLGISEDKEEEAVEKLLDITVEEVEDRMERISKLIDEYEDEEAVSQLKDLLRYNIEIYPVSFVKEIIDSLSRLDYAKASDRIKNRRSEFDEENIISRR